MISYRMHFIRTGSTGKGAPEQYVGQLDLPLCEQGIERLEELREDYRYPRVEMVYTSPLCRCEQTAELLYPDNMIRTVEGLADMNLGRFEGKSFEQLRDDPDFAAWIEDSAKNPPPDGEAPQEFMQRIVTAVQGIFREMMEQEMRSVAVITHGGVIMSLLAGIGLPKAQMQQWATANGTGFTLLFTPQMWMRDGCAEVFAAIPEPYGSDDAEDDDWAFDDNDNDFDFE